MTNHKLLIIDDEPNLADLLKIRLQYQGYQVFYLNSGVNVIPQLQKIKPDLIILDIMMPDRDGYDVCYEIKHNKKTASIPIILFTAKDMWKTEMGELGKFVKADDYICKPFESEDLLCKIKKILKD